MGRGQAPTVYLAPRFLTEMLSGRVSLAWDSSLWTRQKPVFLLRASEELLGSSGALQAAGIP